jgi:hypothetical protein
LYILPPPAGDKSLNFIRALIKNKMQATYFTQIICENIHCPPLAGKYFSNKDVSSWGGQKVE